MEHDSLLEAVLVYFSTAAVEGLLVSGGEQLIAWVASARVSP